MTLIQKIDAEDCGCDRRLHKRAFLSIDQALDAIAHATSPITETRTLPIAQTVGRVLASPVRSLGMTPPFDNSAMDGFAVRVQDFQGNGPWRFPIETRIAAGQMPSSPLSVGHAAQIFTGAPAPIGTDAVIMQEDVQIEDSNISVSRKPKQGQNLRRAGEDMRTGDIVLKTGYRITPRSVAACAAAGHAQASVVRKIRVALLVTGDEVQSCGQSRQDAQIWDVNTPMLRAALERPDIDLCEVCFAADTRVELQDQLSRLSTKVDLIVTSGGISVGEEDHVKPALLDAGGQLTFSGVAIKPGKPVSFGWLNNAQWLGLPGNPLSAFITWTVFGTAVCDNLVSSNTRGTRSGAVQLARDLQHKAGRTELRLAKLIGNNRVEAQEATHSGRVAQLPLMDGVVVIPADVSGLAKGASVQFQPF